MEPKTFIVQFTEDEGKDLLRIIDAGVKALGLPCVDAASILHGKIQAGYKAANPTVLSTPETKP